MTAPGQSNALVPQSQFRAVKPNLTGNAYIVITARWSPGRAVTPARAAKTGMERRKEDVKIINLQLTPMINYTWGLIRESIHVASIFFY
jgi:hypothetical protein